LPDVTKTDAVDSVLRRMGGQTLPDREARWSAVTWLAIILGCVTIGQQIAIPFDESQFGFGFLFSLLIALGLTFRGQLGISPLRLICYMVVLGALMTTLFFKRGSFSTTSLMMLAAIYAPYVLALRVTRQDYLEILGNFQSSMLFCSWCGLVQFGIQFVASADLMFPVSLILPENLLIPGFNLRIPITEGLPYEKSTGVWFLEPSHFSQFLAVAVISELRYFNRPKLLTL
jgi:hypothetical protein